MYHYIDCGLDNIYLKNGYSEVETDYGKGISIHDLHGLHRVIGANIVNSNRPLTGKEIRFLRIELELSQKRLASIFDVTDQTVARWEKEETEFPQSSDIVLRTMYKESLDGCSKISDLIQQLTDLDRDLTMQQWVFEENEDEWVSQAA